MYFTTWEVEILYKIVFDSSIDDINSSLYMNDLLAQFLTAVMYSPILAHFFILYPLIDRGYRNGILD